MLNAFILVSLLIVPALAVALSTVNLTLDEGNAKEFGQVPGIFTVTRTGDDNIAQGLTVRVTVTGMALLDIDYSRPGLDQIAEGVFNVSIFGNQLTRTITLTPVPDNLIEDDETISVQLQDIGVAYTAMVENTVVLTIADFVEVIFKDSFEDPDP